MKTLRVQLYKGILDSFKPKAVNEPTLFERESLNLQKRRIGLDYMMFFDGKEDEEIKRLKQLADNFTNKPLTLAPKDDKSSDSVVEVQSSDPVHMPDFDFAFDQ